MKKIYSLLAIGSLAAASAYAAQPTMELTVSDASGLSVSKSQLNVREKASENIIEALGIDLNSKIELTPEAARKVRQRMNSARRIEAPAGTWSDPVAVKYTDGILSSLLYTDGDMYNTTWAAAITQHNESKGWYSVLDPYYYCTINGWAGGEIVTLTHNVDWDMNATDPTKVEAAFVYTGLNVNYASQGKPIGRLFIYPAVELYTDMGQTNQITPEMYGRLADNKIVYPATALMYYIPDYDGGASAYKCTQETSITLPDGMAPGIDIAMPYCNEMTEGKIQFTVSGDNIAKTYVQAYGFETSAAQLTDADYKYVVEQATKAGLYTDLKSFAMGFTTPAGTYAPEMYTVVAVGVDSSNAIVATKVVSFYVYLPNDGTWKTLDGKATMVDNIIAGYYTSWTQEQLVCEVQENTKTPGLYRLVNPYDYANWKYRDENIHDNDHNHYIYVNAVDPAKAYIMESPLGVDAGDGCMRVNSLAYNAIKNGATPTANQYGTKTGQTITFPSQSVVIAEQNYNNNAWYYTNKAANLKITIPTQNAVGDIITDAEAAAPEYFNLQGVRVANPTPGQMMIVRRGENVTKELMK